MYQEQPSIYEYRVPDDIIERIKARDRTLAGDLTLDKLAKTYYELSRYSWSKYRITSGAEFVRDVLIPERTIIEELLTEKEWKSLGIGAFYHEYIAGFLNYFGDNSTGKEEIDMIKDLILKERVNINLIVDYLRTNNLYVLKFLIDLNLLTIMWIFDRANIRSDIPLMTNILSHAKSKISKEYVLDFLDDRLGGTNVECWSESVVAVLESGIIDFVDLYNIISKYNRQKGMQWANKIIEAHV